METGNYWKINEAGEKIYYFDYQEIGDEFSAVKFFMSKDKVSSSVAHKTVRKIKEFKDNKK